MHKKTLQLAFGILTLSAVSLLAISAAQSAPDEVLFRFSTVGDSREDPTTPNLSAQDNLWLQNTKVLGRMTREILAQKSNALFFNGDMIMGYETNLGNVNRQYAYWRGMVADLMNQGVYVVPVPGNHEVQEKGVDAAGKGFKLAREVLENAWRENMGDLILNVPLWKNSFGEAPTAWDANYAPVVAGEDKIQTSQKQLSYSFDAKGAHFVVIDTDPVGYDNHAPVNWLAHDLGLAKLRGAKQFFVFGHKPAVTYKYNEKVGASGIDVSPDNAVAFWDLIEKYNATYFCGHEHVYNAMQPRKANGGKAWEVIVGSGGSPFEAKPGDSKNPIDRYYAWATVTVYKSGKTHVDAYGFDENLGATKLIEGWDIQ